MSAPTSAAAVANEFLALGASDASSPAIDPMKLQKLVYYAHAWYLANTGSSLFEEDIEAWPWGPVVRNLYLEFAECGKKPIGDRRATDLSVSDETPFKLTINEPRVTDAELKDFVGQIWDLLKEYTGVQLSNSTHADGEPWTIVKQRYGGDLSGKPTIPNSLIRKVFKAKISGDQNKAA